VEPTLKKLRVVITLTTTQATSTIHGEFTHLHEAAAYLRKLADEIETELRKEQRDIHNPSISPDASATHATTSASCAPTSRPAHF
jgi:hypothetical protein